MRNAKVTWIEIGKLSPPSQLNPPKREKQIKIGGSGPPHAHPMLIGESNPSNIANESDVGF